MAEVRDQHRETAKAWDIKQRGEHKYGSVGHEILLPKEWASSDAKDCQNCEGAGSWYDLSKNIHDCSVCGGTGRLWKPEHRQLLTGRIEGYAQAVADREASFIVWLNAGAPRPGLGDGGCYEECLKDTLENMAAAVDAGALDQVTLSGQPDTL